MYFRYCPLCDEQAAYILGVFPLYYLEDSLEQPPTIIQPEVEFCCACSSLYIHNRYHRTHPIQRLRSLDGILRDPDFCMVGWSYVFPPPEWDPGREF